MMFPQKRLRRLRQSAPWRRIVRETHLLTDDLVYPLFVVPGKGVREPIPSMPGVFHLSVDELVKEVTEARDAGVPAVILFGVPDQKDATGSGAADPAGVVPDAVRALKDKVPDLLVWTDVCLCSYTDHGHCGLVDAHGTVLNDESLPALAATALAHAAAGADAVAPSDMMDGRIGHIREKLDSEGYDHVPVVSYAAKFASAFYGPFRDAAHSAPAFGDRRSYQMDSANSREALEEIAQDIDEGADIVMVKPALAYLDVIRMARDTFSLPIAAYQVSGEYSMIKATAERGWIGEREIALETLLSIKRAGADIILTYFAKEAARWLNQ